MIKKWSFFTFISLNVRTSTHECIVSELHSNKTYTYLHMTNMGAEQREWWIYALTYECVYLHVHLFFQNPYAISFCRFFFEWSEVFFKNVPLTTWYSWGKTSQNMIHRVTLSLVCDGYYLKNLSWCSVYSEQDTWKDESFRPFVISHQHRRT